MYFPFCNAVCSTSTDKFGQKTACSFQLFMSIYLANGIGVDEEDDSEAGDMNTLTHLGVSSSKYMFETCDHGPNSHHK